MSRHLEREHATLRLRQISLFAASTLALAGHNAAAQSSQSVGEVECPAALRTPGAQHVAAGLLANLQVHKENSAPNLVFKTFQRDFHNAAMINLPGSEYRDNKGAFDNVSRATVAACFAPIDALLTDIEQRPMRKALEREHAQAERQAAEQQAAQARQQADADVARRQSEAMKRAQQEADEASRAHQAEVQALAVKQQQQALADNEERARLEKEWLQQIAETAAARAAEQQRQAQQLKEAAETDRTIKAEADRKQQIEQAEQDRVEQAWVVEDAKPRNVLVNAYRNYIAIRQCAASRDGYAIVYVVPERLEQAKVEIRTVESNALRQDPSIDKNAAWQEANGPDQLPEPDPDPTNRMLRAIGQASVESHDYNDQGHAYCEAAAYVVDQLAKATDPAGTVVKKDF